MMKRNALIICGGDRGGMGMGGGGGGGEGGGGGGCRLNN